MWFIFITQQFHVCARTSPACVSTNPVVLPFSWDLYDRILLHKFNELRFYTLWYFAGLPHGKSIQKYVTQRKDIVVYLKTHYRKAVCAPCTQHSSIINQRTFLCAGTQWNVGRTGRRNFRNSQFWLRTTAWTKVLCVFSRCRGEHSLKHFNTNASTIHWLSAARAVTHLLHHTIDFF